VKSPEVITVGESLVEIMRKGTNLSFLQPGVFLGPYPSGAPAIFISTVATLGQSAARTGFISVIGRDDFGTVVTRRLKNDRVDISCVRLEDLFTGTAFVRYYPDGSRKFIFHPGAAALLSPGDVRPAYFKNIRILHITGSSLFISNSSFHACEKALKLAEKHNALISFDPNIRPEMAGFAENVRKVRLFLQKTGILFITEEELAALFGEKEIASAEKEIFGFGVRTIVLKKGRNGSEIICPDGNIKIRPLKVRVVDPTGAGDTYAGAFIAGFLRKLPIEACGKFASAAASLKCTRQGPMSIPSIDEVEKALKSL